MTDIYRRPVSGEAFQPSAREVGSWKSAAEAQSLRGAAQSRIPIIGNQSHVILVKNTTDAEVPRNGLMRVDAPVIPPAFNLREFLARVVMTGSSPARDRIAVLALEPIAPGKLGRCLAPGLIVPARIETPEAETYFYARPSTSTAKFDAVDAGNIDVSDRLVEVLWHEAGAGEKWALVLMPGAPRRAADPSTCGACSKIPTEGLVIDLGGGFEAAEQYLFAARCGPGGTWLFTWDSGSIWLGVSDNPVAPCDLEEPRELWANMVVASRAPGGVVVTLWAGASMVAVWVNETAWEPCGPVRMLLLDFDPTCVCVAWMDETCLVPVPAAED